jgi:hypothetical protein
MIDHHIVLVHNDFRVGSEHDSGGGEREGWEDGASKASWQSSVVEHCDREAW